MSNKRSQVNFCVGKLKMTVRDGKRYGIGAILLLQALVSVAEQPAYQHGISLLHELKYPADFNHFEYADPDARKGGELILSTTTNIRNFSSVPGTGVPSAQGIGRTVDRLMIRSADELSGLYGQLAMVLHSPPTTGRSSSDYTRRRAGTMVCP